MAVWPGSGEQGDNQSLSWRCCNFHYKSGRRICRYLIAAGRISPEPRKRLRSSFVRFEADLPNEMWQTDMCHVPIANIVANAFTETARKHGFPASVLSDNDTVPSRQGSVAGGHLLGPLVDIQSGQCADSTRQLQSGVRLPPQLQQLPLSFGVQPPLLSDEAGETLGFGSCCSAPTYALALQFPE